MTKVVQYICTRIDLLGIQSDLLLSSLVLIKITALQFLSLENCY